MTLPKDRQASNKIEKEQLIQDIRKMNPDISKQQLERYDIDDLHKNGNYYDDFEGEAKIDELSLFIDEFTEHVSKNFTHYFPKELDARVADSILELFRKRENIDVFNKKALYIYIREMVDVKTPKITKIANQLYAIFKEKYLIYLDTDRFPS